MKKIHIIKVLLCLACINLTSFVFSEGQNYTVKSSEERINVLISVIEKNLEGSSVLTIFKEEQQAWELYKKKHIEMLFPDEIDNVKMLWGTVSITEMGNVILVLNLERIKILETYLTRNGESGTDGKGDFKEYVEELKRGTK